MRIFARRERPHPGAQLSLFETRDGWRYSLWATNQPTSWTGWRADPAYIDAAHRVHARIEDRIRTGKDTGIGHFPSTSFAMNAAWLACASIAATLLAWLRHLAPDGELANAEPKTLCATASCTPPPDSPEAAAADGCESPPPGPGPTPSPSRGHGHHDAAGPLTRRQTVPTINKGPGTCGTPGQLARQPGHCQTPRQSQDPSHGRTPGHSP